MTAYRARLQGPGNTWKEKPEEKIQVGDAFILVVQHLDWGFRNPEMLVKKLRILNQLADRKDLRLVLISQTRPESTKA